MTRYEAERLAAISIGTEAALTIRGFYDAGSAQTYIKSDHSPVTDADLASDRIIRTRLAAQFPDDAILTEEGVDDTSRLSAERCWIVDPIDGTQQFVDRTGQFDVLIALVVNSRPVVGVMIQPTTGLILSASAGEGAWVGYIGTKQERLQLTQPGTDPTVATTIWFGAPESEPFLARFAAAIPVEQPKVLRTGVMIRAHIDATASGIAADAQAIPPANMAHGMVGVPMRGDGTMAWEWDYAAPDIIVNEAGGRYTDWHGQHFAYNKPTPRNVGGLVIANTPGLHSQMLSAIEPLISEIETLRGEQ